MHCLTIEREFKPNRKLSYLKGLNLNYEQNITLEVLISLYIKKSRNLFPINLIKFIIFIHSFLFLFLLPFPSCYFLLSCCCFGSQLIIELTKINIYILLGLTLKGWTSPSLMSQAQSLPLHRFLLTYLFYLFYLIF